MQEEYHLKLELNHLNITKFKEKDVYILTQTINGSRLGINHLKFLSYGYISFNEDDKRLNNAIVTPVDKFNRLKVNCVIFDMPFNPQNDGYYDKLFIFSDSAHEEYYNYVMYNSETGKQIHKFLIDKQIDILLQTLTREFHTLYNADIYDFYLKKGKAIDKMRKQHSNYSKDVPGIVEWKQMIDKHNAKVGKYCQVFL